jgi:hypothetical protein
MIYVPKASRSPSPEQRPYVLLAEWDGMWESPSASGIYRRTAGPTSRHGACASEVRLRPRAATPRQRDPFGAKAVSF